MRDISSAKDTDKITAAGRQCHSKKTLEAAAKTVWRQYIVKMHASADQPVNTALVRPEEQSEHSRLATAAGAHQSAAGSSRHLK